MNSLLPPATWALPIIAYAFSTSITPGPNNTVSAMTGANFGFRAGVPHVFGVAFGFIFLLTISTLGVASILMAEPRAAWVLKATGIVWLLWLAYKLFKSASMAQGQEMVKPFRFHESALFQLSNPKAWVMALGVSSNFIGQTQAISIPLQFTYVFLIFSAVNIPCQAFWLAVGAAMRSWLQVGKRLAYFNSVMAILLALTALSLIWV